MSSQPPVIKIESPSPEGPLAGQDLEDGAATPRPAIAQPARADAEREMGVRPLMSQSELVGKIMEKVAAKLQEEKEEDERASADDKKYTNKRRAPETTDSDSPMRPQKCSRGQAGRIPGEQSPLPIRSAPVTSSANAAQGVSTNAEAHNLAPDLDRAHHQLSEPLDCYQKYEIISEQVGELSGGDLPLVCINKSLQGHLKGLAYATEKEDEFLFNLTVDRINIDLLEAGYAMLPEL